MLRLWSTYKLSSEDLRPTINLHGDQNAMSARVFISYSRKNQSVAKKIYDDLRSQGLRPWRDEEDLLPGQNWELEIKRAMKKSDFILLLLSRQANTSKGYFQKEIRIAHDLSQCVSQDEILLIPVRVNDCGVPPTLKHIHFADLFPSYKNGLTKVLRAIQSSKPAESEIGVPLTEATSFLHEVMNWDPIHWKDIAKHQNVGSDITRREIIRAWTEENRRKEKREK